MMFPVLLAVLGVLSHTAANPALLDTISIKDSVTFNHLINREARRGLHGFVYWSAYVVFVQSVPMLPEIRSFLSNISFSETKAMIEMI